MSLLARGTRGGTSDVGIAGRGDRVHYSRTTRGLPVRLFESHVSVKEKTGLLVSMVGVSAGEPYPKPHGR